MARRRPALAALAVAVALAVSGCTGSLARMIVEPDAGDREQLLRRYADAPDFVWIEVAGRRLQSVAPPRPSLLE